MCVRVGGTRQRSICRGRVAGVGAITVIGRLGRSFKGEGEGEVGNKDRLIKKIYGNRAISG